MSGPAVSMPLLVALVIPPRLYAFGLLIDLVAAAVVYRSSERFAATWGTTPGRVPSAVWGVLMVLFGVLIGGIAYFIARASTMRRLSPGGGAGAPIRPGPSMPAPPVSPVAGWYTDPSNRHELRYWDGRGWSDHVMDHGERGADPLEAPR